jgi:hypothetical protein
MNKKILIGVFAAAASLHAAGHILVASNRSNSLEEFNTSGTWLRTFASTGPYGPIALAQSPLTGEIFVSTTWASGSSVGQLTNRILRYEPNGHFNVDWDTFTVACGSCPTAQTQSLLFDSFGNLWVATAYGTDLGGPIYILKYLAANLKLPNPSAEPMPIKATLYRGNQMAFNGSGDLCIASFIDGDVQCFDTSTAALTHDYSTEIHHSSVDGIEPGGLAFDGNNRMYLTSIFTGQVVKEVNPGGPIEHLATLTSQLDGNLVLHGANLYTSTYNVSPLTFSSPDPVYEVSSGSGAVTKFIHGTAAPGLGNDHIWGAYWMIFY